MIQIKKTILTLVALLAVTTGAWADETPLLTIENKDYKSFTSGSMTFDDKVTVTFSNEVYNDGDQDGWYGGVSLLTVAGTNGYTITSCKFYTNSGTAANGYTVEGESPSVYLSGGYVYTDDSKSVFLGNVGITKIEVYGGVASASTGPKVDWDKDKKTGTFTMPGGNVTLEPEYYPQAALTAAPTAINDVPATTDGAIVKAGTVANIGTTETAQGTVMYYVSQTALDDDALLALAADQWKADVPTAEKLAQGQAYVYYYVRGNDSDNDEENFSDGDILAANALTARIAAEPTYAVTFKAANANTIEDGKATVTVGGTDKTVTEGKLQGVKMGSEVKVKANTGYKFRKVEVKKAEAGPLAAAFKDGAKFKVGYKWNSVNTTYLEFTNSGGTYSLTSVSGLNEANGFNSSTLTVKDGNVLALDVVCHPEGTSKMDRFCAQIEFDATSSTYKYSSKGSGFTGIISVSVNDADITSQLTEAN